MEVELVDLEVGVVFLESEVVLEVVVLDVEVLEVEV